MSVLTGLDILQSLPESLQGQAWGFLGFLCPPAGSSAPGWGLGITSHVVNDSLSSGTAMGRLSVAGSSLLCRSSPSITCPLCSYRGWKDGTS